MADQPVSVRMGDASCSRGMGDGRGTPGVVERFSDEGEGWQEWRGVRAPAHLIRSCLSECLLRPNILCIK